jgi:hypothetical protein
VANSLCRPASAQKEPGLEARVLFPVPIIARQRLTRRPVCNRTSRTSNSEPRLRGRLGSSPFDLSPKTRFECDLSARVGFQPPIPSPISKSDHVCVGLPTPHDPRFTNPLLRPVPKNPLRTRSVGSRRFPTANSFTDLQSDHVCVGLRPVPHLFLSFP